MYIPDFLKVPSRAFSIFEYISNDLIKLLIMPITGRILILDYIT